MISEKELINLIHKEEQKAKYLMYKKYIRYLTAICSRYISCDEDIKDILQESFFKILTRIERFEYRGEGTLKAWMSRIVLNETLKWLKSNQRFEIVELDNERLDLTVTEPDTEGIPTDEIYKMIRELPVGYRTVFNLFVIEEKSHKEIAKLLGIKENSSASQLHRAKALLAEKINRYRNN